MQGKDKIGISILDDMLVQSAYRKPDISLVLPRRVIAGVEGEKEVQYYRGARLWIIADLAKKGGCS